MKKVKQYKTIVAKVLKNRIAFPNRQFPNLKDILIIDEQKKHFILLTIGWDNQEYIHQVLFHLEVKSNGKIWIHENRTDILIDEILVSDKVNKLDIINGMIESPSIDRENFKAA